jgi:hypothetical protein
MITGSAGPSPRRQGFEPSERCRRRIGTSTAGLLATLFCLGAAAPQQTEWLRIDSPNFVIIGEVGARDLSDIAVQFEGFREALKQVLGEGATSTAVPTIVIVFPSDRAFTPLMPKLQGQTSEVGGRFMGTGDINYIAIVSDGQPGRLRLLFHEYAHLAMSNVSRYVPPWLSEGMAEYYSTFELTRGGLEAKLGGPIESHLALLKDEKKLLTLEELLKVDHQSPLYNERDTKSAFYAQAWALTHLILRGEPNRSQQLTAYLDRLSKGVPPTRAWQEAFGSEDMGRELVGYIRRASFREHQVKFNDKLAALEATAVALSPAEAQAHLSDFLLRDRRLDEASERLALAAQLDMDSPRVIVGAALLDIARRDYVTSDKRLNALATPQDWLVAYLAGTAVAELAKQWGVLDAAGLETARRFFAAASAERPAFPNAVARIATLELRTAEGPSAATAAAMAHASTLSPGRPEYALLHAQVLVRRAEFAEARLVLGPLTNGPYPAQIRDGASDLMGVIPHFEAARASALLAAGAAPPISADRGVPEAPAWPVYREKQAGEERLEGVLERIECVGDEGAVFHLKAGARAVTVTTAQRSKVDYIVYRDDLTGGPECGPLKEPMAVYVTWRPATDKSGAKIAVAIEYLPKKEAVRIPSLPTFSGDFHAFVVLTIGRIGAPSICRGKMEAPSGFEPEMEVLQTGPQAEILARIRVLPRNSVGSRCTETPSPVEFYRVS